MSQRSLSNMSCNVNKDKNDIFYNLFAKFSEELDCHKKAKILVSLVQTYLLHFKDEIEPNVRVEEFEGLLTQIPLLCSKFLQTSTFKSDSLNETESIQTLENKNENLESASLCFDAALACLEACCMTKLGLIMIKISLNVLSQGYTHCKESEVIYGDLLEQSANQLGLFFKKIENLQMVVLQQLDKLDIKKYSDDLHYNCIVIEMGNLCQIVFSLDADIAFELWTKYIRIVTDHRSLKQISNIDSVSTYLASKNIEVLESIKYSLDKNSEEDDELCAKFFFYFDALSSMLNLVRDSFKENISEFKIFLLSLFHCLLSSYSPFVFEKSCMNIVKNSLEKNTFALLSCLYTDEEFVKLILSTTPDEYNHVSIYLLKLCALQFMECSTLQLKENFLKNIFSNFLSATSEDDMKLLFISIPQCTVTKTKSGSIALYQFAYEQLSEFSKLLPDSVIRELENTVISYLVSSSDIIYLLISDVWIYRLRCSSIEFLKDHCNTVLQNYSVKNVSNIKIENLIRRMLRFLPHSYREMLHRESSTLKLILDSKNVEHRYGAPDLSSTECEISIDSEQQVKTMMCKLNEFSTNDVSQLVQKACLCLELCALFVNISGSSEILQFSEFAAEMFKSDVYEIQIAVLTFIKALSRKSVPEHTQEFGKIVICLAQLFSNAMKSKNYIIRYEARNVFSYFAKCTPHIKIVQETVRQDPSLKPAIKAYINAVPDTNLSAKMKTVYLQKQMLTINDIKIEIPTKIVEALQQIFSRSNF